MEAGQANSVHDLLQALTYGTSGSEGLGGAWVALSALRLQCLEGQAALDAAAAGLTWLRARQEVLPGDCALLNVHFHLDFDSIRKHPHGGGAGSTSVRHCALPLCACTALYMT